MKTRIVGLTVAVVIGSATLSRADTITITGGLVELAFQSGATAAHLTGPGTDIRAFGTNVSAIAFNAGEIEAIQPNNFLRVFASSTSELIGGTQFPAIDTFEAQLALRLSPFHADVASGPTASFSTPFSLTGNLALRDPAGAVAISESLRGVGTAVLTADVIPAFPPGVGITQFVTRNIAFQFSAAAPAPTPEPMTLVLLGTGLIAAIGQRRLTAARRTSAR